MYQKQGRLNYIINTMSINLICSLLYVQNSINSILTCFQQDTSFSSKGKILDKLSEEKLSETNERPHGWSRARGRI